MDLGLKDKKVIVTASSKGIGFAIAKRFLEEGSKVVISSHDEGNLIKAYEKLKMLGEVYYIKADLTKIDEVKYLINEGSKRLSGLDVLVYVTGSPKHGSFLELNEDEWNYGYRLLILSAIVAVKEASKIMNKGGRIIISTSVAIKEPIENLDLSNILRISMAGLIRTASKQLGKMGILINGIMPGYVMTDRIIQIVKERSKKEGKSEEEIIKSMTSNIPVGRIAEPEEIANVAVFLASNLATYINGAIIPVDGGLLRSSL
jgi:Dehydrogenases with different specificities (related to short-chain alcohol dehydrogenases)